MGIGRRFGNTRRLRWLFFALAGTVGVLSLLPQTAPPGEGVDLALHTLTYAGLMGLFAVAFRRLWLGAAGLLVYSSLLEGVQAFVPERHGSLADVAANSAGIGVVLLIGVFYARAESRPFGKITNRKRGLFNLSTDDI